MEEQELNKINLQGYYPEDELTETESIEIVTKVEEKAESSRVAKSFLKHLRALGNYLLDKDVKWYRKAIVAAALVYFLTPIDSIPDFVPFAGFLDDIGIVAWTIRFLGNEIEGYY
jgi:uncharacterized membrane protein YkvA (DUF1232 family)